MNELKPGDMLIPNPSPGRISIPGPVVVNAVYNTLPMSEVTDQFNVLRKYRELHALTGGGKGIKIGVCDTGVDKDHLEGDLKGTIAKDFTRSRYGFYDQQSHGTHTTGHIGARGDGQGFLGLAPNCDLYHAKVLGDDGSGSTEGIAKGVRWLIDQGCHLINMSLGGGYSDEIEAACRDAVSHGAIVLASMGNSGHRGGGHPGTSKYTLGITAVDYAKRVAGFSSRDPAARYTGYGVQVLSLINRGKLGRMSGTSMSCPDQTGLAANILSYMLGKGLPLPTMDQYETLVQEALEDLGDPGHDREYGLGFIDVWKVIEKINSTSPEPPPEDGASGIAKTGIVAVDGGKVLIFTSYGDDATITHKGKTYYGKATVLGSETSNYT